MSGFLSELGGITGGVGAEGLAFAAGFAAAHALEPEAVTILQDAWHGAPVRRIDPITAAAVAAESYASYGDMSSEARYSGWDDSRFAYLYRVTLTAPGTGELLQMLRRGTISDGNFSHGLRKAKLEPMWDNALADLANQKISATDLAYMMVRGVLPDDGLLGMSLPTQADNLKLPPQLNLDPVTEAALTGWDRLRLAAMVARSGLAMAPVMAAQARFRNILTQNDYELTIARGDLFPAFAEPVLEVSRAIPTPGEFVEARLRGWITQQQMWDGAALHGMTNANADLLYEVKRRPLTPHAIKQALARGAKFNPAQGEIQDPYTASVHQANLGPEWYEMGVALQGSYPSLFITNRLVTSGIITPDDGKSWLERSGLADEVVTAMDTSWKATAPASGTKADPHVTKAENQLWATTYKGYLTGEVPLATAKADLGTAGVAAAAVPQVLAIWDTIRAQTRKSLSAAQIKKAWTDQVVDPATGVAVTKAEAVTRLQALGYTADDADILLVE